MPTSGTEGNGSGRSRSEPEEGEVSGMLLILLMSSFVCPIYLDLLYCRHKGTLPKLIALYYIAGSQKIFYLLYCKIFSIIGS
jgi:hypothetical protein